MARIGKPCAMTAYLIYPKTDHLLQLLLESGGRTFGNTILTRT